jgi:hypothetical protein
VRWIWWILGAVAAGLMLYECALPGDLAVGRDSDQGLAGTYTVNGVNATGQEYSGTLVITGAGEPGGSYDLEWIVTGSIQRGTGRLTGDRLVVSWSTVAAAEGTGSGTAELVVQPDGRLVGTRFDAAGGEVGTEEIFPEA